MLLSVASASVSRAKRREQNLQLTSMHPRPWGYRGLCVEEELAHCALTRARSREYVVLDDMRSTLKAVRTGRFSANLRVLGKVW